MKKLLTLATSLLASTVVLAALPEAGEIPKEGGCPSNYVAKGDQCRPTEQAMFAFIKSEQCPEAYETQGNYCVATAKARLAIRRAAMSCPSGFASIGNYCVAEK